LRAELNTGRHGELASYAHSFKGMAASIGAQALAFACGALEEAILDNELAKLEPLIAAIEEAHRQVLEVLERPPA
jgi:HPt (histidine-containing phosphotransfer) domain-containing protein